MARKRVVLLALGLFLALARPALAVDPPIPPPPDGAPGAVQPPDGAPGAVPPPDGAPGAVPPPDGAPVALPPPPQVPPVNLRIPTLGVDADVLPVGVDADGEMGVPTDPDTVVWWALGAGTGVPGNVVMAGHLNWGGRPRVFGSLEALGGGENIVVVDQMLREYWYEVQWAHWVADEGAPVEEIFSNSGVPELTLITCGGRYEPSTRSYLDRLIVRARQV